jgi:cytidine deaminase
MKIFRKGKLSATEITEWLVSLRGHAHVPESGFPVTAVFRARVQGVDDYYFAGVNVENAEHRLSTHGEEGAIAAMVVGLGPQAEIVEGWVMGALRTAPVDSDNLASCCGKCRQQIAGFATADVKIHAVALNGKISTTTVGDFLPDVFTFRQFLTEAPAVKKTSTAAPSAAEVEGRLIWQGNLTEHEIFTWLERTESVDYASKIPQAIVLQLDNGAYVAGAKVEEAAFNDMNAAQCALAIAVSEFGIRRIVGAWVYPGSPTLGVLQTLSTATQGDIPIRLFDIGGKAAPIG